MSAPKSSMVTANVCLPEWNVTSLVIPANRHQRLNSSRVCELYLNPEKTLSVFFPRSPIYVSACLFISKYSCPPVFFCLKTILVKSPNFCTSPQVSFSISLFLIPVRHEKRKALLSTGYLHSVFASNFTSSNVR